MNPTAACAQQALDTKCIDSDHGIVGSILSRSQGNRIDPLLNLSSFGLTLMDASTSYWVKTTNGVYRVAKKLLIAYTGWMAGSTVLLGLAGSVPVIGGIFNVAAGILQTIMKMMFAFDLQSLTVFLPLGAAIAGTFFVLGVTLGIYVPLIPFLIYLFTVIGWLIAVIEAMIGAPLVALGITHPQGHDLLGKSEQAVILLLGIFIRPAAILLGFMFAITLLYIAAGMVNIGFISTIVSYFISAKATVGDGEYLVQAIVTGGMLIAYAYIMMSVINQVFGMIYQVPEKLLRWIGSAPEQSGVGQMLGEVKQGVTGAGSSVGQGAQAAASKPPSVGTPDAAGIKAKDMNIKSEDSDDGDDSEGKGDDGGGPPADVPPVAA